MIPARKPSIRQLKADVHSSLLSLKIASTSGLATPTDLVAFRRNWLEASQRLSAARAASTRKTEQAEKDSRQ